MLINSDQTALLNDVTSAAGELLVTFQELEDVEFENEALPAILSSAKSVVYDAFMPLINKRLEDDDPPHTGQAEKIHWAVLGLRAKVSLNPSKELEIIADSVVPDLEHLIQQIDEATEDMENDGNRFRDLLLELKESGNNVIALFNAELEATD